jgi:hypothetical protein
MADGVRRTTKGQRRTARSSLSKGAAWMRTALTHRLQPSGSRAHTLGSGPGPWPRVPSASHTSGTGPSRRIRWPKPAHEKQFPMCFGAAPWFSWLQARNGSPSTRVPRFTADHHPLLEPTRIYRSAPLQFRHTTTPEEGPGPGHMVRAVARQDETIFRPSEASGTAGPLLQPPGHVGRCVFAGRN